MQHLTTIPPRIAPGRGEGPRRGGPKTRGIGAARGGVPVATAGESRIKYTIFKLNLNLFSLSFFCLDKATTLRLLVSSAQDMVLEAGRWTLPSMPLIYAFQIALSIIMMVSTCVVPH